MDDKIGRKDIVNKIDYLIETLPQNKHFCLALNGAWGSGKSVVIELLRDKLLTHPEYIVVHYDAWKNNFYSDPLIAMLYCILDTLEQQSMSDEITSEITSQRIRKTAATVAAKVGKAVVDAAAEQNPIVGFIKTAIVKIKSIIKAYKETALTNNPAVEEYKSYSSFLNETITQLNEITTQNFYEDRQTRLIVLVDEIDRCLPNEQLIVLERLHHLFEVKNCAVIVALNKDAIHKNFEKNYGGNSEDYLQKFFQYSFQLSAKSVVLLRNRLVDVFYEINDHREDVITDSAVTFILDDIANIASETLSRQSNIKQIDNRDVEKFINDGYRILYSILNYHPAFLSFALRLLIYRRFNENLFKKITEEKYSDKLFLCEIESFGGGIIERSSYRHWELYRDDHSIRGEYQYYTNVKYNDLLYLFNLCRYRNNDSVIKEFVGIAQNSTFKKDPTKTIEQIKTILSEIERYGN